MIFSATKHRLLCIGLVVPVLAMAPFAEAAIYQCQDARGKLGFSDRPCAVNQAQTLIDKEKPKGPGPASASARVRPMLASYCEKSIKNGRLWLSGMREAEKRDFESGGIAAIDYQEKLEQLRRLDQKMTTSTCLASSAGKRKFYECLNSTINSLASCLSSHGPI